MSQEVLCIARDRDIDKDKEKKHIFTDYECDFRNGKLIIPEGVKNLAGFQVDESFSKVETMVFPATLESIESLSLYPNERYDNGSIDINVNEVEMAGDEQTVLIGAGAFKDYHKLYQNGMLIIGRVLVDCERSLENVTVPDGIEVIGDTCFGDLIMSNGNLKSVSFPSSLKSIRANAFRNCKALINVSFKEEPGIESIGNGAFAFCPSIKDFYLPNTVIEIGDFSFKRTHVSCNDLNGVTIIGRDSFYGTRNIEPSTFSEKLINEYGGLNNLMKHIGVADSNGLLIKDGSLKYAYHDSSRIEVPDEVSVIDKYFEILDGKAENDCVTIVLPKSLKEIAGTEYLLKDNVTIELPDTYLRQKKTVATEVVYKYLRSTSSEKLLIEDYVSLFLLQGVKKISQICEPQLKKDCNMTADCMIDILNDRGTQKGFNTAKAFIIENRESISLERVISFYNLCEKHKKTKITEELDRVFDGVKGMCPEMDPIEEKCRSRYKENIVDEILKKASISTNRALKKAPVLYKESGEKVPEFVVRCVLSLYMDPIIRRHTAEIPQQAEKLVALFDKTSFQAFLRLVGDRVFNKFKAHDFHFAIYGIEAFDYMIPMLCRLLDERFVDACIAQYHINEQCEWEDSEQRNNLDKYNELLVDGIIMSDTSTAIEFCKRIGSIDRYALFRGLTAVELSGSPVESDESDIDREGDLKIAKAIALYDDCIKKLDRLMGNYYNRPTVEECSGIGYISKDNELAKAFFERLYNRYSGPEIKHKYYDYMYDPQELFEAWKGNGTIQEGQVGLCYTIGMAIAYYMFESSDIDAEIVYCRDKWEYRGDYSSATRVTLHITPNIEEWRIYNKEGYPVRDM